MVFAQKGYMMPLVSVITPVFNAGHWLSETLASTSAQTLTNWEHLLVDDGSSDDSLAIIEATAAADPRFHLLRTPHNSGPGAARNLALETARGRFIAFLDADDLWLPEKLARSVEWITTNDYDFIYHDYRYISNNGEQIGPLVRAPEILDFRVLHTRRGHGGCLSFVLDRERIGNFRFPENLRYLHEDFGAWLSLVQQGHVGHRLPADLGRCRLSPTSRSGNKLHAAAQTWQIYREVSRLPRGRAARWWVQYAWNSFWLRLNCRPR